VISATVAAGLDVGLGIEGEGMFGLEVGDWRHKAMVAPPAKARNTANPATTNQLVLCFGNRVTGAACEGEVRNEVGRTTSEKVVSREDASGVKELPGEVLAL